MPDSLVGKREGLFFLWAELERARIRAARAQEAAPHQAKANGISTGKAQAFHPFHVDEFIFF